MEQHCVYSRAVPIFLKNFFSHFFLNFPNPHLFCWWANIWGLFFIMSFCLWGCLFLRVHELADNEKVITMRPGNSLKNKAKVKRAAAPCWRLLHRELASTGRSFTCHSGGSPWWLKKFQKGPLNSRVASQLLKFPPESFTQNKFVWKNSFILKRKKANKTWKTVWEVPRI